MKKSWKIEWKKRRKIPKLWYLGHITRYCIYSTSLIFRMLRLYFGVFELILLYALSSIVSSRCTMLFLYRSDMFTSSLVLSTYGVQGDPILIGNVMIRPEWPNSNNTRSLDTYSVWIKFKMSWLCTCATNKAVDIVLGLKMMWGLFPTFHCSTQIKVKDWRIG